MNKQEIVECFRLRSVYVPDSGNTAHSQIMSVIARTWEEAANTVDTLLEPSPLPEHATRAVEQIAELRRLVIDDRQITQEWQVAHRRLAALIGGSAVAVPAERVAHDLTREASFALTEFLSTIASQPEPVAQDQQDTP